MSRLLAGLALLLLAATSLAQELPEGERGWIVLFARGKAMHLSGKPEAACRLVFGGADWRTSREQSCRAAQRECAEDKSPEERQVAEMLFKCASAKAEGLLDCSAGSLRKWQSAEVAACLSDKRLETLDEASMRSKGAPEAAVRLFAEEFARARGKPAP